MRTKIFTLGSILLAAAIIWLGINHFSHWDVVMTPKERFIMNWKAVLLAFIGFCVMKIVTWLDK